MFSQKPYPPPSREGLQQCSSPASAPLSAASRFPFTFLRTYNQIFNPNRDIGQYYSLALLQQQDGGPLSFDHRLRSVDHPRKSPLVPSYEATAPTAAPDSTVKAQLLPDHHKHHLHQHFPLAIRNYGAHSKDIAKVRRHHQQARTHDYDLTACAAAPANVTSSVSLHIPTATTIPAALLSPVSPPPPPSFGRCSAVSLQGMKLAGVRHRGEKKPIPDEQKDDKYFERRKRNNEAAKKSRDARKFREDRIAFRANLLEQENAILKSQIFTLRDEVNTLRQLVYSRKSAGDSHHSNNTIGGHSFSSNLHI